LAHIQIASTPCFIEQDNWPGIKPNVLSIFAKQLKVDHEVLLRRFLMLQNMGLRTPKFSVNTMLNLLTRHPPSSVLALEQSLALLHLTDLREMLAHSKIPCQRIYGGLDSLVPPKVVQQMNSLCINSRSSVIEKASHAPFLSHPEATFDVISAFLDETFGLSRLDCPD
jgi:pimeloyl-[acyl-carrier protein] methyl ester esterase